MHAALLLALSMIAQDDPAAMEFRNLAEGQTVRVWVWCYKEGWWNNGKPATIKPQASSLVKLHPGRFRVYFRNQFNQQEVRERTLVLNEVDRMRIDGIYGNVVGQKPPPPRFAVSDDEGDQDNKP